MGRTGSGRAANLFLVPVGPFYRPPLALAERPDLAAAFERGRRDRAAGRTWQDMTDAEREDRMAMDSDALHAYSLGHGGETWAWAPAPLPLILIPVAVDLAIGVWLERRRRLPARVAAWLVGVATVAVSAYVGLPADRRHGRRLALKRADAPVPARLMSGLGFQMLLALAYGFWVRGRTGHWPRTGPGSMAAARLLREVQRRRSWHAALAASRQRR